MLNKLLIYFLLVLFFILCLPIKVFADDNSFITIINPVRISSYIKNPADSLGAEYTEIAKRNLPATWLLTYDAMANPLMLKEISTFDNNQELGIFLEVTSNFARKAEVVYNARDSWHRATSLFLSGYSQEDRIKLIDTVFSEFKKKFGYYPKSVGSWWTDSYSLLYITKKYGATSNLSVSDQYSLDGYTVWGTPWSTPYYPSNINAAIPAKNNSDKISVVMLRWAPRDPLNGYKSPTAVAASMYSPQDYTTIRLPDSYFQKITSYYSQNKPYNKFTELTFGLESDFPPETFGNMYSKRLDDIIKIAEDNNSQIVTARNFTSWYQNKFKNVSPPQLLITDDFLGTSQKAIWFQNSNYRAGFVYDSKNQKLTLNDLRSYYLNFEEPFYKSPNDQNYLFSVLPYIIDSSIYPKSAKTYSCGNFISNSQNEIEFDKCNIKFYSKSLEIKGQNSEFKNLGGEFNIPPSGLIIYNIGFKIPYGLIRRIPQSLLNTFPVTVFLMLIIFIFIIYKFSERNTLRFVIFILLIVFASFLASHQKLFISQSEYEALKFLNSQPAGKVLVSDQDCLKCSFQTPFTPAAAAGYKKYVAQLSNKQIIESLKLPLAKSPADIKKEINSTNATYVYFAKYEGYLEQLPYPANFENLKVIYENANAQILKVVK